MLPSLWMETVDGALNIKIQEMQDIEAGLSTVETIIKETINQKINHLTLYTFSTENWKRPKKEIFFLFSLLENFLLKKIDNLIITLT